MRSDRSEEAVLEGANELNDARDAVEELGQSWAEVERYRVRDALGELDELAMLSPSSGEYRIGVNSLARVWEGLGFAAVHSKDPKLAVSAQRMREGYLKSVRARLDREGYRLQEMTNHQSN